MRSFASDNFAPAHPAILQAIAAANRDHAPAYGADAWTQSATRAFRRELGDTAEVAFVFNGTGANVVGLSTAARSFEAVICTDCAHIHCDECGAPEKFGGFKLLTVPHRQGKLTAESVATRYQGVGSVHHVQPKVISITQSTELGTVYTPSEIQSLADFAHARGMYLHVDGARLANAAAALGVSLRAITADCGVDLLSFGGTKNGLLFGEAVVVFREELKPALGFVRKQAMQLPSKMRFVAAQFEALLTDELWLRNAAHANAMAERLAKQVARIPGLRLTQPVEANALFVQVPRELIEPLQKDTFFWIWDEALPEVRWMTAFDTTEADIDAFCAKVRALIRA